jgi:hypothetical protein
MIMVRDTDKQHHVQAHPASSTCGYSAFQVTVRSMRPKPENVYQLSAKNPARTRRTTAQTRAKSQSGTFAACQSGAAETICLRGQSEHSRRSMPLSARRPAATMRGSDP